MPYPESSGNSEASQTDTMVIADQLFTALLDRASPSSLQPENLDPGVWALSRIHIPVDKIAKLFEIQPGKETVLGAEMTYIIEQESDSTLAYIDLEITSQTVFSSQLCIKQELWELYLTSERLSTVYVEYSNDGHRLPLRERPEVDMDPALAYSIEQGLAFRNLTPADMRHLERLKKWLAAA